MKKAFRYLPAVTAIISLPAMAHVGYTDRNFGTFDNIHSTTTLSGQAVQAITAGSTGPTRIMAIATNCVPTVLLLLRKRT